MEKDKVKIQTKTMNFTDVEKALKDIELKFNDLNERINSKAETEVSERTGQTGDIKSVQNADKSYSIEIKTEDGWKKGHVKGMDLLFEDKPKDDVTKLKKSIDEIETDDTSTGASNAEKTIFDEKDGKFKVNHLTGIPRPDYDSGWLDIARDDASKDNFTLAHGLTFLNSSPTLVIGWFKDAYGDKDGAAATNIIYPWLRVAYETGDWRGANWRIDSTNLYIQAYTSYYIFWNFQDDSGGTGTHKYWNRIAGRILIWK